MGLTERHWFENEEPELTDRQLEDAVSIQDRVYRRGYHKGYSDRVKEQEEERRRMISWLGKFCRHIDNGDKWLSDKENIAFFREKMKQQFGWDS